MCIVQVRVLGAQGWRWAELCNRSRESHAPRSRPGSAYGPVAKRKCSENRRCSEESGRQAMGLQADGLCPHKKVGGPVSGVTPGSRNPQRSGCSGHQRSGDCLFKLRRGFSAETVAVEDPQVGHRPAYLQSHDPLSRRPRIEPGFWRTHV